jgi:ubiquinone biosynthesis monooxygenase Coq7
MVHLIQATFAMPNSPFSFLRSALQLVTDPSAQDNAFKQMDQALKFISTEVQANRPNPSDNLPTAVKSGLLSSEEKTLVAGLMRVNHVGEVCAQALYQAQAQATNNPALKEVFIEAAKDEADHLAWTGQRLSELGAQPSVLNPVWYAGAYGLGWVAGKMGDATSLGFLAETEKQVEAHLTTHLKKLPAQDHASRAIVEQMRLEEAGHGHHAAQLGGTPPALPVRLAMRFMSKIMTTVAQRI